MNILRSKQLPLDRSFERVTDPSVLTDKNSSYLFDESKLLGQPPLSITFPKTINQIAAVLAEHYNLKQSTTISAARSGVVGGAVPCGTTHLLSLEKLIGIKTFEMETACSAPVLSVLAGTALSAIDQYLEQHHPGYYYPVDPTYRHASIGGSISTNASGMRTYFYGSTRQWVQGLTIILANGEALKLVRGEAAADKGVLLLETGGQIRKLESGPITEPATKHSIGYHFNSSIDPLDLIVAAEGTLGVIAEVDIRLAPRPQHRLYLLQFFRSIDSAFQFSAQIQKSSLRLLAVELLDERSLKIAATHPQRGSSRVLQALKPHYSAAVFLDIWLDRENELGPVYEIIEAELSAAGAGLEDSIAGTEDRDLADIKVFRHAVPEMINRLVAERKRSIPRLHKYSTDMSVPQSALRELFDFYEQTLSGLGLDYFIFGHFGSGHLHVNIVPKTEQELDQFLAVYLDIGKKVIGLGGAVAGEHGIGRVKKEFLKIQFSPAELESLRKIRSFFDPDWLLNPGVLIDR